MTQLTAAGLEVSRLADRIADLTADVRLIFGADIDLEPDTVDGQTLGLFAEAVNSLDMLLEEVYQAFDPNSATGKTLATLVQLNGITKAEGTYSTVTATLGGRVGVTVPALTLLHSTATLAVFQTDVDAVITASGFVNVTCTATTIGVQEAPAGTLTAIDSPAFGLQTVTNAADALVGRDPETDGQLRVRRAKSTAFPSQTIREGIEAAVANLPGVTQARVYENDQSGLDPVTGQAANSIYAVVEGGVDADIARAIYLKKTAGIPTLGSVVTTVTGSDGRPHGIQHQRPTHDLVYFVVNVSQRTGFPADGAQQIKDAIEAYGTANYEIGQEVIQSDFYAALAGIPGKSITSLFLGLAPAPASSANLATLYDHLADFDAARVTVNVT